MTLRKRFTIGLALLVLALGFTTLQAKAEEVLTGSFDLPAAAYWGDTLLQPGHYTITMNGEMRDIAQVLTFRLSGEGIHATFLAVAKPDKESGRNHLEIANVGGAYVVKAFEAGTIGESFAFSVTKSVKNKALRASAEPPISVAVLAE